MKYTNAILFIALFSPQPTVSEGLRSFTNDTITIDQTNIAMVRSLQVTTNFVPLSCNANIASATCTSWTNRFGSAITQSSRIIIPCGQCITMNHPGPTLTLQDGMDIQGKLVFPNSNVKLEINTPMVVVQGLLDMQSTKPVDGIPMIKFIMTGSNEQTFTPIGSNANTCGGGKCTVGKKSFTVAGGKLNGMLLFRSLLFFHVLDNRQLYRCKLKYHVLLLCSSRFTGQHTIVGKPTRRFVRLA
jgi:hypothetical protein